ncbi:uncharacterized protein DAT39_023232, partial [Clarias magur]
MSPPSVRLGTKHINALMVELRARLRDIGRDVVGHQLKVRRSKSDRLVDASKHNLFIEAAPEHIVAALDELEKRPTNRSALRLFFGFLADYIIAITGHRKGVVINMTTEEVQTAEKAKDGAPIIRVEQHKTQRYFSQAAVPLKSDEYAWFERYIELREYVDGGSEASMFFHSSSGGVLLKMGEYFKEAWEGIDLGVASSFNMLRSSVATYAKRQLGSRKVATFMCHDEHTTKRFYQADEPAEEILRSRYLSTLAVSTYAAKKRSKESKKASRHNVDSSDDDGKATENDSEEEEEQERQMVPKGDEGEMVASLVQQQEMEQTFISPGTASLLRGHSSKTVILGSRNVKRNILQQPRLHEGASSTSGSVGEAGPGGEPEMKEEALEIEESKDEGPGGEAKFQEALKKK